MTVSNISYQHKISDVAGAVPNPNDLEVGQILINIADTPPSIYTKNSSNQVVAIVSSDLLKKQYYTKADADKKFIDTEEIKDYYTKSEADQEFVTPAEVEASYLSKQDAQDTYAKLLDLEKYVPKVGSAGPLANYELLTQGAEQFSLSPTSPNATDINAIGNVTITVDTTGIGTVASVKTVAIHNNTSFSNTLTVKAADRTNLVWQSSAPSWGSPNSHVVLVFCMQGSTVYASIFYSSEK